jgi:hypothetical protein
VDGVDVRLAWIGIGMEAPDRREEAQSDEHANLCTLNL